MKARWSTSDRSVYTEDGIKLACIQQRGETEFYVRYGEDGHKSHLEPFECEVDAFKFIVKDLNLEIVT